MRFNHYLKENKCSESPRNIIIVDTEAHIHDMPDGTQEQTFRLGCILRHIKRDKRERKWSESELFTCFSVDDFHSVLNSLIQKNVRNYIVAHNMAYDYTLTKMDTFLSNYGYTIGLRVIDSVFLIKASLENKPVILLSSTNFYKQSLDELGKIFGLSKMEHPDFRNVSDEELAVYCERDTKVLSKIMLEYLDFIKGNDLGGFKPTIAGQAMTSYRHRFMHSKLLVHNYSDILELESESYRGGRCEAFKIGYFNNIYKLDINSMYPYVMKHCQYPTSLFLSKLLKDVPLDEAIRFLSENRFLIANCNMILKEPVIGCKREKLVFPIGKVRQSITSPELKYILEHPESGSIESINYMAVYSQDNIFSDYVDFFYDIRKSTDNKAIDTMCKIFLNSLYGKFGQRHHSGIEEVTNPIEIQIFSELMKMDNTFQIIDVEKGKYIKLGDKIYLSRNEKGEYAENSIPSISSAVTSYARILLWSLLKKAGRNNVLYCDTDSLFVNKEGYHNLESEISTSELGKLKLEEEGFADLYGVKDYTFNHKVKLKGIKRNSEKIDEQTYKQYHFETKNARYRKGTPDGIIILRPIIKHVKRDYDKGIVTNDTITPFSFNEF